MFSGFVPFISPKSLKRRQNNVFVMQSDGEPPPLESLISAIKRAVGEFIGDILWWKSRSEEYDDTAASLELGKRVGVGRWSSLAIVWVKGSVGYR